MVPVTLKIPLSQYTLSTPVHCIIVTYVYLSHILNNTPVFCLPSTRRLSDVYKLKLVDKQ